MSQVNSGIATKACTYDFAREGALGANVFAHAGIALLPGETILDIRVNKTLNFASSGGNATTFSLGWGPAPSPGVYFTPFFTDTIGSLNTYIINLYQSPVLNKRFLDTVNNRYPTTVSQSLLLYFTSSAALTSGSCSFFITYAYAKF